MATIKRDPTPRHFIRTPWVAALVLAVLGLVLVGWFYGAALAGNAAAGSAYGAKNACSCRYLAGRSLDSCETDFVSGMELVMLSEDEDAQSVTAYVPLLASETATYREGFGCTLEPIGGE